MGDLICPICHEVLTDNGISYQCINNHNYDKAKKGYVNLLTNPDKKTNNPGDSKDSLLSRRRFLQAGYYDLIIEKLNEIITRMDSRQLVIADIGCGEGYYLSKLKQSIDEKMNRYYGIDIAKDAIMMATNYDKQINWIVANNKNIPLANNSVDVLLALFTMINEIEVKRILKKDGIFIEIEATNNHLIELKHLVYKNVIVKNDKKTKYNSIKLIDSINIEQKIEINNNQDGIALLKMTPHYYRLNVDRKAVLENMPKMSVTLSIKINVYK